MAKNKEYFDSKENTDFIKLTVFNEQVLHLKDLGQTPYLHHTDASGYTKNNTYINMELKDRECELIEDNGEFKIKGVSQSGKPYTANTLYIEQHKVCGMLLDWVSLDYVPVYINFLKGGVVIVHKLHKLNKRPYSEQKTIKSRGYNKMEIGQREGLYLSDAAIYKMDENNQYQMIKKPQ